MDSQFIKRQRPSSVLPKALPAALFLVVCMVSLPLAPGLAQTKPLMDLRDSMSVDEVNRSLAQRASRTKGRATFHFGFDLRSGPLEDARQYLPFLNYLSRATGYDFKLRFTSKSSSIIDDLGTGKVHFAAVGAVSFIKAHENTALSTWCAARINRAAPSTVQPSWCCPIAALKTCNISKGRVSLLAPERRRKGI